MFVYIHVYLFILFNYSLLFSNTSLVAIDNLFREVHLRLYINIYICIYIFQPLYTSNNLLRLLHIVIEYTLI